MKQLVKSTILPKSKAGVLEAGYRWRDPDVKEYKVTVQSNDLPDHIKDVSDDILNQIIGCEHAGNCNEQCMGAFKIIPLELQFYRAMNLALPRLCSNCRHYNRLRQRTPFKLWDRKCHCGGQKSQSNVYANTAPHFHSESPCPNTFKTSYAPDRSEIIYCQQCYQAEVV